VGNISVHWNCKGKEPSFPTFYILRISLPLGLLASGKAIIGGCMLWGKGNVFLGSSSPKCWCLRVCEATENLHVREGSDPASAARRLPRSWKFIKNTSEV